MTSDSEKFFGCIGVILSFIFVTVGGCILNGWALVKLWGWFILPRFESAPALSISQAIGITIVVSFLTHQVSMDDKDDDSSTTEKIVKSILLTILKPLSATGIGWIVAQYV